MSTQVHMRHRDGELNSAYAHIDSFVNEDDVKIHANGSCCPCAKKEPEKPVSDYNLDINKPKINGHTLIGNMTGEELGLLSGQNAYEELIKVKDYLYEAYYKTLDYQYALDYFINTKISLPQSGCTTIRKGNYYGRNYDWTYDKNVEFIIKTPHINDRYAVMGVAASIVGLTQDAVDEGKYNELYKIVPFRLVDGINEKGVIINTNVVPTDKGINDITVPAVKEEISICSVMLPRFILDHFATAREAAEYLRDYTSIYAPKTLEAMGYEAHWIIADENETYLIEIINKQVIITNMSENSESHLANRPYMTNFYLSDITLNDNGEVYTPEYRDGDRNAISYNHITPHGCGLERYNYIVDNYDNITNKEDLRDLLLALRYTNAYRLSTTPAWNTEFVGLHNLTVVSTPEEYRPILENAAEIFATRTRDEGTKYSGTWQTTHSSIYDFVNKTLSIVVQEDGEELNFEYSELTPVDPGDYPQLTNKPQINGIELLGNKTTADLLIDQDFVKDHSYVHTDNNYTNEEKEKLASLENYDDNELREEINRVEEEIPTKTSELTNDSGFVTNVALTNYSLITETGNKIELTLNESTYVMMLTLKDKNDNTLSAGSVDLPLESIIVNGRYDAATKKIILVLKNGTEISFSVADLVNGLQTEITPTNKLSSDLVDDTNHINKFTTLAEKTMWYAKAEISDIPTKVSELTNDAGYITGYTETDPVFTASAAHGIMNSDIVNWNNKPEKTYVDTQDSAIQTTLDQTIVAFTDELAKKASRTYVDNEITRVEDEIPTVPTNVSAFTNDAGYITGYTEIDPIFTASAAAEITSTDITTWNNKSDFSGDYNDLTNKPNIPTKTSDLTNDNNFIADASYVHTDNNYSNTEKLKLAGLENYDDTEIRQEIAEQDTKIQSIETDVDTIESKIPSQATSSNQLADKNFVNSSIATNTAYFRGTFNSIAELMAYAGEKTLNDYAYVIIYDEQVPSQVKQYDRYKYNNITWEFEYTLNNSSFTAAQWSAINSGITSLLVNKINDIDLTKYYTKTESDNRYIQSENDPTVPTHVKNITQSNINDWNNKQDNTNIIKNTIDTTITQLLANNTSYRFTQNMTSITIQFGTMTDNFESEIVFVSGTTPASFNYSETIKWSGDDVENNIFAPKANKTYTILIWYDNINLNAMVRGV